MFFAGDPKKIPTEQLFYRDLKCFLAEREGIEPLNIFHSKLIVYNTLKAMVYHLGNFEVNAFLYVMSTFCLHVTQVQS